MLMEEETSPSFDRVLLDTESSIGVCSGVMMDSSVWDDNSVEEGSDTAGVDDSPSSCALDVSK